MSYTDGWRSKQNRFYVCLSKTFYFDGMTSKLFSFGRIDTYFESCGILRKYVLRNSSQSKKLKGNLPIGQLVSHTSKEATKANHRKEFSYSCRELSWKAHGVGAIIVSTNTHSIGSDCHWLFISGHEEITSDYR